MPHDKDGAELRVGDTVNIPCRVKAIHVTEDYCNVDLETLLEMPPTGHHSALTLNSRQVTAMRQRPHMTMVDGHPTCSFHGKLLRETPLRLEWQCPGALADEAHLIVKPGTWT